MFDPHPSLKTLETRRQLLVTQAEVHRAQLLREFQAIQTNVQILKEDAKFVRSTFSGLLTVLSAVRDLRESGHNGQSPFVSRVLRGARFASTVWQAFRPRKQ